MNILIILDMIWTHVDWQEGNIALLQNMLNDDWTQCVELLAVNFRSVDMRINKVKKLKLYACLGTTAWIYEGVQVKLRISLILA
jgi:hypothetical protein